MPETQKISQGYVTSSIDNNIATIEFFHPQSNSLPGRLLDKLADEIATAGNNPDARAIVLRSAGDKTFCAGASFNELAAIATEMDGLLFFTGFAKVINAMRKAPKFIIARIQGKCVGGGVGLAASADYAIAVEGASIKLSELAIGIGPFVIGPAVERKIGNAAFSQLAIGAANWQSAAWAEKAGLFTELHGTAEGMDAAVAKLSRNLSQYNPDAMAAMKTMLWQGTDHWDKLLYQRAAISGKLAAGNFAKEAIAGFLKK